RGPPEAREPRSAHLATGSVRDPRGPRLAADLGLRRVRGQDRERRPVVRHVGPAHRGCGVRRGDAMSRIGPFLAGAILVAIVAVLTGAGTYSAFFSRTSNDCNGSGTGNEITGGTVDLTDNDAGNAMFTISNMRPSDPPVSSCITVTYNGTLNSSVGLYGSVS